MLNRMLTNIIRNVCRKEQKRLFAIYGYNEEFIVGQTSKIHINCPYNVFVKPVIQASDDLRNKVFVQFNSLSKMKDIELKVWRDEDNLYINSECEKGEKIKFSVLVPMHSDLFVTTTGSGNINVEKSHGDNCLLVSENGNITIENCNHISTEMVSKSGNIISNGTLKAVDIKMETDNSGCIVANHLQAIRTILTTDEGDVRTQACYSDISHFKTKTGKLVLNNVHKFCNVDITDCGILQMSGFDGTLNVNMKGGEADIQVSKLHDESIINVEDKSPFLLRLSETVMDNSKIETFSPSSAIAKSIKMIRKDSGKDNVVLIPFNEKYISSLVVNLENSHLVLEEASWADMAKLKHRNF